MREWPAGEAEPMPDEMRAAVAAGTLSVRSRTQPRHLITIAVLILMGVVLFAACGALGPFVLGALLAYLLGPIARLIEGWLPSRGRFAGTRRIVAVLLTFVLTLLAFAILLTVLRQPMIDQTTDLLESLPTYRDQLHARYGSVSEWYEESVPESTRAWIDEHIQDIGSAITAGALALLGFLFNLSGGVISALSAFVMIPLFMIYFMIDQPRIPQRLYHQLPASWADDAVAVYRIADRILGSYTRGVVVEALIVGAITGAGYWLIGVEVALPLAVIAFAGEIVPILGPWIAFFISFPVVLATQPDRVIPAIAVFGVVQMLEGWIITPKIQEDSVDFSASMTLLLLAVGGALGGVFGMLIALPVAAVSRALIVYVVRRLAGLTPAQSGQDLLPGARSRAVAAKPAAQSLPSTAPAPAESAR